MNPFEWQEESIDIFRFAPQPCQRCSRREDKIQNADLTKIQLYDELCQTKRRQNILIQNLSWSSPAGPETGFEFIDLLLRRVYVTPGMDRGRGLQRLNSIYDFTQPQPYVMDRVKHEENGICLKK